MELPVAAALVESSDRETCLRGRNSKFVIVATSSSCNLIAFRSMATILSELLSPVADDREEMTSKLLIVVGVLVDGGIVVEMRALYAQDEPNTMD